MKNIAPAVSLLLAVIHSWPPREAFEIDSIVCASSSSTQVEVQSRVSMPFPTPTRGDVAKYLEDEYLIINIVSVSIIGLKKQFDVCAKEIESECEGGFVSEMLQDELNEFLVGLLLSILQLLFLL